MLETEAELAELQDLLDRSYPGASRQYQEIARPERLLTARQVAAHLQGMRHIALATVTRTGAPRVMPLDSFFFHGRFVWSTASYAVRITHLRRDPRCSAVHFEGDDLMVAVHGRCVLVESGDEFEALDQLCLDHYGSRATSWGSAITFGRIEPERMYAWAHHPENYPELDS